MAAKGEIGPMPDCAIFSDTQGEAKSVYNWLDYLIKELPFPVHVVTGGDLAQDGLQITRSKKSGKLYLKSKIPAYVLKEDGTKGLLGRKCTEDYKVQPIQKKVRELVGIKRAGAGVVHCRMWIGISTDEAHRMKPSRKDYIENCWPLIDHGLSRQDCLEWMEKNGYPEPPRSSCVYCPFHSDFEWHRLKVEEPEEFKRAVEYEEDLQEAASKQEALLGEPFLHSSGVPLHSIDFEKEVKSSHQQLDMFGNECEGMCGV
tara:strand:+ start:234 stop:1007 length:774 start_codon:yes stop_codon:yes gene_type:complete